MKDAFHCYHSARLQFLRGYYLYRKKPFVSASSRSNSNPMLTISSTAHTSYWLLEIQCGDMKPPPFHPHYSSLSLSTSCRYLEVASKGLKDVGIF